MDLVNEIKELIIFLTWYLLGLEQFTGVGLIACFNSLVSGFIFAYQNPILEIVLLL